MMLRTKLASLALLALLLALLLSWQQAVAEVPAAPESPLPTIVYRGPAVKVYLPVVKRDSRPAQRVRVFLPVVRRGDHDK